MLFSDLPALSARSFAQIHEQHDYYAHEYRGPAEPDAGYDFHAPSSMFQDHNDHHHHHEVDPLEANFQLLDGEYAPKPEPADPYGLAAYNSSYLLTRDGLEVTHETVSSKVYTEYSVRHWSADAIVPFSPVSGGDTLLVLDARRPKHSCVNTMSPGAMQLQRGLLSMDPHMSTIPMQPFRPLDAATAQRFEAPTANETTLPVAVPIEAAPPVVAAASYSPEWVESFKPEPSPPPQFARPQGFHRHSYPSCSVLGGSFAEEDETPAISTAINTPAIKVEPFVSPPTQFMLKPWGLNNSTHQQKPVAAPEAPAVSETGLSATEKWQNYKAAHSASLVPDERLTCSHCMDEFVNVDAYVAHIDEHKVQHDKFCPDHTCMFAAIGFRLRLLLRRHICNQHLNVGRRKRKITDSGSFKQLLTRFREEVYVCGEPQCLRAFYRLDSLLRHHRLIHNKGDSKKKKVRLGKCGFGSFD